MPRLKSGRQVEVSFAAIHEVLEDKPGTSIGCGWIVGMKLAMLKNLTDAGGVMYFRENQGVPPDAPTYYSGFTVGDLRAGRSDWSDEEVAELCDFLEKEPRAQAWIEAQLEPVRNHLRDKPAWGSESSLKDLSDATLAACLRKRAAVTKSVTEQDVIGELWRSWANPPQTPEVQVEVVAEDKIPLPMDELRQLILDHAARPEVHSVSCCFTDHALWRGLLEEQVRRAHEQGIPPREALQLSGPDSGIPGINCLNEYLGVLDDILDENERNRRRTEYLAQDASLELRLGGCIHIPYEGMCGGDFLVVPTWRVADPARWHRPGAHLGSVLGGGVKCNFLLTERDLGESPCATRSQPVTGWWLYESTKPLPDCNPFHRNR